MNPIPKLAIAALLLALAVAAPAFAGPYKCTVDGKTVYQDHPCAGLAPVATVVAPPAASTPTRAQRSPRQISDELEMARRHERELKDAYQRETALARARLATMDAKSRQREQQQIEARWQPRILAERKQAERLQAELLAACPLDAAARPGCPAK